MGRIIKIQIISTIIVIVLQIIFSLLWNPFVIGSIAFVIILIIIYWALRETEKEYQESVRFMKGLSPGGEK